MVKKYGFTTVFSAAILSLMIMFGDVLIDNYEQQKRIEIDRHKLALDREKSTLGVSTTMLLVEGQAWFHSEGALKEIQGILINNHIAEYPDETRLKIANLLTRRSNVVIQMLNNQTAIVPRLGDEWRRHYRLDELVQNVFAVVTRPIKYDTEDARLVQIGDKLDQIRQVLMSAQNAANRDLETELRRKYDERDAQRNPVI